MKRPAIAITKQAGAQAPAHAQTGAQTPVHGSRSIAFVAQCLLQQALPEAGIPPSYQQPSSLKLGTVKQLPESDTRAQQLSQRLSCT
jgi:hypothetical protein